MLAALPEKPGLPISHLIGSVYRSIITLKPQTLMLLCLCDDEDRQEVIIQTVFYDLVSREAYLRCRRKSAVL